MGWGGFAVAFVAFFVTHSVPLRPVIKGRLQAVLGVRGFTAAYSALSLGVLSWLIIAAGNAPFVAMWAPEVWHRQATLLVMLLACLVLSFGVARPNPFSFGGAGNDRFDPARPGIVGLMRHPLLVALAFWAGVHVLANGDLAHVILFGCFAGFALMGQRLIDRRKKREMGAEWSRLREAVGQGPLLPRLLSVRGVVLRFGIGLGLYVLLIGLHPVVIGVSPLP
ncbi:MAG: NnrU family protein [Sulfitobacter sp.]